VPAPETPEIEVDPVPIQPGVKPVPLPELETPEIEVDPIPIQPGVNPVPIPGLETPELEVDPVPIQPGVKPVPLPELDTPNSSRVSISMPILVWTSSQRGPLCNRTPNLKPSTEPDLH
jgi:hypothetical protein